MAQTLWSNAQYSISTERDLLDLRMIHNYLSKESYWATGIPFDVLQKSIDNSFCFGMYQGAGERGEGGEQASSNVRRDAGESVSASGSGGAKGQLRQVGFARVVTDYATFAWLADVFVLAEFRGQGLSKWLVQTIVEHPELQRVRRFMLATQDAHTLYSRYGFMPIDNAERFLAIARGTSIYTDKE